MARRDDYAASETQRSMLHMGSTSQLPEAGTKVWNRDLTLLGRITGGQRRCRLAGCTGTAVGVRWEDLRITFPCLKGMRPYQDGWKLV